ncbi:hypothetical protein [Clostridium felsineum]|uniref:Uncharacterized protein n=1 Tax=Clostridium felsineum TaxID=36839 RepID=A0A1S8KZU7_9CLOT|nr:hypothetical protein [Clostridium felsineum]URZ06457.1 hypothetical protein CLROS_017900 [Clostridium felsineum]URZ11492.1 hypothetical protein CROST_022090 [Clostridium felsineum]
MCDCIKQIEEEIKINFPESAPALKVSKVKEVKFENLYWDLEDNCRMGVSMPIRVDYERKTKKGNVISKHEILNMQPKYCPFCGKPYKEE